MVFFTSFEALSTESDNFTVRAEILAKKDASENLEQLINMLIQSAVTEYNQTYPKAFAQGRTRDLVRELLRKRFATDNFGQLAWVVEKFGAFKKTYGVPITPLEWVIDQHNLPEGLIKRTDGFLDTFFAPAQKDIDKLSWGSDFSLLTHRYFPLETVGHRVSLQQSIYGDLNELESGLKSMPRVLLASSVHIENAVVGIDKIGHFFSQGLAYAQMYYGRPAPIPLVLNAGKSDEESVMGGGSFGNPMFGSGVVSYGDLAANISGMLFWFRLFDGNQPYLRFEQGRWQVQKAFKFKDYPVAAWDEAINPSHFHKKVEPKVRERIEKLGFGWMKSADPKTFDRLKRLPCSAYFLSPVSDLDVVYCPNTIEELNEGFIRAQDH